MIELPSEYLRDFYMASISIGFWLHNKQEVEDILTHYDDCMRHEFQQTTSAIEI